MAKFQYKARDLNGRQRTGVVEAADRRAAQNRLGQMRLKTVTLVQQGKMKNEDMTLRPGEKSFLGGALIVTNKGQIIISAGEKITSREIIVFTKQLSAMINSGVPLVTSIDLLARQQRIRKFGNMLYRVREDLENGAKLSECFARFPRVFDDLFVSLVRAGEASGSLDKILLKLVEYTEKAERIKKQIKSAMTYPIVVIIVAIAVVTGLLVFVVPKFADQFKEGGKPLPALTQWLVDFSDSFAANWHIYFGALFALFVGTKLWARTKTGEEALDKLVLTIPVTGELVRKVAVGRFCSIMATMLSSGINMIEALTICAAASGSKPIENFILNTRSKVEQGIKMSTPLGEGDIFPPMVVSMIEVGENTGAIDEMLKKVSDFYEEEVELAVAALLSMIEPLLIVFLGGIVGFVIIALYLPIFDMAGTVG